MSKKKTALLIATVVLVILIVALSFRAIHLKKKVTLPPSIEKLQEEQGIPVKVISPSIQDLEDLILVDGTVEAEKKALVVSRIDQIIEDITVDEGDSVEKGETVVLLQQEAIASNLMASQSAREEAERDYQRAQSLFSSGAIPLQELEEARVKLDSARARQEESLELLRDTRINSPLSGLVSRRQKEPGELVSKGEAILEIVDIDTVEIHSPLSEILIKDVRAGQPVRVYLDAYPEQVWEAKIKTINPTAHDISRLFTVKIGLPNPEAMIKPGMYARVQIIKRAYPAVMVLPQEAIIQNQEGERGVFLVCNDQQVSFTPVSTGISQQGLIQITSGLDESCRVVVSGQDRLIDGSRIQVISNNLNGSKE